MFNEFKKFALKGNMLDLAVAFIMGGAFGTIVSSLVKDVLMPPLGLLMGGVDFSALRITLKSAVPASETAKAVEAVSINYGAFLNNVISFVIVAFAMFLIVKAMNKLQRKEDAAPAAPSKQELLLAEIRDLLKEKHGSLPS